MYCFLVTFGYEFFTVTPEYKKIALGIAIPYCKDCGSDGMEQAISVIGAIIMPHNLYLHSALVKSRKIDTKDVKEVKSANRYVLIESSLALFVSFLINLSVTAVFAKGVYGKTNEYVYGICAEKQEPFVDMTVLENNTDLYDADIYKAGIFLGCQYGALPFYIFALGILASGHSSTMTGTYAGQFAMEGFLNLKWPRWKRVLLTRTIAIAPTLGVAVASNLSTLAGMNTYLNALMVLQVSITFFVLFSSLIFLLIVALCCFSCVDL